MTESVQLYEPDKFKVQLGRGLGTGFCSVWNEPQAMLKRAPELADKCAIIGTLYGRQGVSIIIRNLALNPQIRRLYVWGNGPLSNTKFGVTGTEVLFALWKNGLADDGKINGSSLRLEKEIDPEVVRLMITRVELVDISDRALDEAASLVSDAQYDPYMEPVRFPAAVAESAERLPSEEVGWVVRDQLILGAWLKVIQRIMLYGAVKGTQYGMPQRELINITWVVTDEDADAPSLPGDWPQELRDLTGADAAALEEYYPVILNAEARPGTKYTYGNRLKAYHTQVGDLDQVKDGIISQMKSSPDTRRAVATTLVPEVDVFSSEPPCLTQVQCLQTNGALHFLATFRSHDLFKAAIANAFGLRKLQQEIAAEVGFLMGSLVITSQSAHIYEADWAQARKLIDCSVMLREPDLEFRAENADPRGNLIIRVKPGDGGCDEKLIEVALMSPDGVAVWRHEAPSARHIQAKLSQMDLLSSIGHALDVGMELQKAQIALEQGLEYVQDRPLRMQTPPLM